MVLLGILLQSCSTMAQTDSVTLDYYFDDQGISTGIMIKTDLVSIIHGDVPLIVESRPKRNLTFEGGLGVLLPYYVHDFLPLAFSENKGIDNNRYGYSARLHLKWYIQAPEMKYWGIQYYHRAFDHIKVHEWFFTRGDQRIIGKRLLVDVALGLGYEISECPGK